MKRFSKNLAKSFLVFFLVIIVLVLFYGLWRFSKSFEFSNNSIVHIGKKSTKVLGEEDIKADYIIKIDKISLKAPIIMSVDGANENKYFKALEDGVAQMQGTAKFGEKNNAVIFGHSSQIIGGKGKYGEVFAKLNDLEKGDEIKIQSVPDKKDFVYQVYDKQIVPPEDVSVIEKTSSERLTLITCWPIGSDQKRLVIFAKSK